MPLVGACCKLRGCKAVEARLWPSGVVVDPPCFDDASGLTEVREEVLVETFVAQPAVEGLDEAVLRGFAWRDIVPADLSCRPL